MTLDQAIKNLELFGSKAQMPPAFRGLTVEQLERIRDEVRKPTAEDQLAAWARQPLRGNPLDKLRGIERPPEGQAEAVSSAAQPPLPAPPDTPFERALRRPQRSPGRQRAAFLRQLERCLTVAEAATRAGVNRGTVYRWKEKDPEFARRWDERIRRLAEETGDTIALQVNRPEIRQVFYKGKRTGEHQRFNHRLLMHVQNRLDNERRRAEDRAERRELALLRQAAERAPEKSQPATPEATPEGGQSACPIKDLPQEP